MTRSSLRSFLRAGVMAISPAMPFGSGRITEFNSYRSNEYPTVWWESVSDDDATDLINQALPLDTWPVNLHIGKKDTADSSAEEYEQLLDDCYDIAQQLVHQYSQIMSGYSSLSITNISKSKFVKKHADIVTGCILSFTVIDPDATNLC
jgi:hypothetical protein